MKTIKLTQKEKTARKLIDKWVKLGYTYGMANSIAMDEYYKDEPDWKERLDLAKVLAENNQHESMKYRYI